MDHTVTGEFIEDLTVELGSYGTGSFISEFVCGGPKNYAYKVMTPSDNSSNFVCKVNGIRLSYEASQLINFNSIRNIILNNDEPIKIVLSNIRTCILILKEVPLCFQYMQ